MNEKSPNLTVAGRAFFEKCPPGWYWLAALLILLPRNEIFIRPYDDPRALLLYSLLLFLAVPAAVHRVWKGCPSLTWLDAASGAWLVYGLFNPILTGAPLYEGLISRGQWILFYAGFVALRALPAARLVGLLRFQTVCMALSCVWLFYDFNRRSLLTPLGFVNYFSGLVLLYSPWAFSGALTAAGKRKVFWGAVSALFVAAVAAAGRKTALFGVPFVGIGVAVGAWRRGRVRAKFSHVAVAAILLAGLAVFVSRSDLSLDVDTNTAGRLTDFARFVVSGDWTAGLQGARAVIALRVFEAFGDRPWLGFGYGNFRYAYNRYYRPGDVEPTLFYSAEPHWLTHPHNEFLFQLFEGGIVGVVLFLAAIAGLVFAAFRGVRSRDETAVPVIWGWIAAGFVAAFDNATLHPTVRFAMVSLAALTVRLSADSPRDGMQNANLAPARFGVIAFAVAAIFLGGIAVAAELSVPFLKRAEDDLRNGGVTAAHRIALRLAPESYDALTRGGLAELTMGNLPETERLYGRAYALFPDVPQVMRQLAGVKIKSRKPDEALEILERAHRLYPFNEGTEAMRKNLLRRLRNKPVT